MNKEVGILKLCTKCNKKQDISSFTNDKYKKDGKRTQCRNCDREYEKNNIENKRKYRKDNNKSRVEYMKKFRSENKEMVQNSRLKKIYGISYQDYSLMLESQKYVCAICEKVCQTGRSLAVDHCHTTGKIRGLLCSKCNVSIGLLNDDYKLLEKAYKYLYEQQ
jgi:hypothetical protein